jgi:hypothetical protein
MILRPYQLQKSAEAVAILSKYKIVYLAMEPRIGKTHTSLLTAKDYGAKNVLFLTKKKALRSIESDYSKGGYGYGIKIINYEQLGKFDADGFDFFICDESHCLGAYPKASLRTKHLRMIIGSRPTMFLSATPTPESYSQIFHQLWVSRNSPYNKYSNFYQWARDYVTVVKERRGIYEVNNYDNADERRIKYDLEPIMITYAQEQAGFTCPVNEIFHSVDIPIITETCKRIFKDRILCFGEESNRHVCLADTPASLMSKMHQLSSGAVICDNKTVILTNEKAEYIRDTFAGKRYAVFYKFQADYEILKAVIPDHTIIPEDFQEGKSNVFISQILSGREGIALSTADAIVFYAIDYSATSYWQSRARLQDLHRTTPAEVHWIFVKGGIEKKVYGQVSKKKDFTAKYFFKNCMEEMCAGEMV